MITLDHEGKGNTEMKYRRTQTLRGFRTRGIEFLQSIRNRGWGKRRWLEIKNTDKLQFRTTKHKTLKITDDKIMQEIYTLQKEYPTQSQETIFNLFSLTFAPDIGTQITGQIWSVSCDEEISTIALGIRKSKTDRSNYISFHCMSLISPSPQGNGSKWKTLPRITIPGAAEMTDRKQELRISFFPHTADETKHRLSNGEVFQVFPT